MRFCELCQSLILDNACINKRCKNHDFSLTRMATYKQICYIKDLHKMFNMNDDNFELEKLTFEGASSIIDDLLSKIEIGDGL